MAKIVQKYFEVLRTRIRNETKNLIERIKQKEKNELVKLDELQKSMNENLLRRAEKEPELKQIIKDLNAKLDELNSNVMPYEQALIRTLKGHTKWVNSLVSFYDHKNQRFLLASAANDKTIKLWNVDDEGDTIDAFQTLTGHSDWVMSLVVVISQQKSDDENNSNGDDYLISGSYDKTIKMWNLSSPFNEMRSINFGFEILRIKQLSEEELVVGGFDGNLKILNLNSGETNRQLKGHAGTISDIVILSNRRIATCSDDGSIKLWNTNTGQIIQSIDQTPNSSINALIAFRKYRINSIYNKKRV